MVIMSILLDANLTTGFYETELWNEQSKNVGILLHVIRRNYLCSMVFLKILTDFHPES